jgi:putative Mg2+ transporter-C (MgtC) family protein
MPSDAELVLRLLLAAGLSGALGIERELTEQPAGVRTHMLVGMGAALFAIVSAYGFGALAPSPGSAAAYDPTRIAAQIVVGIGFLGAGVIVKAGTSAD